MGDSQRSRTAEGNSLLRAARCSHRIVLQDFLEDFSMEPWSYNFMPIRRALCPRFGIRVL